MLRVTLFVVMTVSAISPAYGQGNAAAFDVLKRVEQSTADATSQKRGDRRLFVIERFGKQTAPHPAPDCLALQKLKIGQTGFVDCWQFQVLQVVGRNSVLLSSDRVVVRLDRFDTRGLKNQQPVRLLGPVSVDEKVASTGPNESRGPFFAIHLLTEKEMARPASTSGQPVDEQVDVASSDESHYATWHSKAGTTVVAKFVRYSDGKVELLTKDGRTLNLPLSVFTDADANRLRELLRDARK